MKLLRYFRPHHDHEHSPPDLMSDDMRRRLQEAEGKLTEALSDHRVKMDWARDIARQTLQKLDEGHKS